MTSIQDFLTEGPRIFISSMKNRFFAKKYSGSAREICQEIVKDCWNGRYFQTSTGNFAQFWTRDFGWCAKSLVKLGYEKEVQRTLRYALNRFQDSNKITTTITPKGRPYEFPLPAADSLPWLIHSIQVGDFSYHSYKPFLNKEIKRYFEDFINPQTGLVKPDLHVSSIKDFTIRKSSCYDNTMVALLAKHLKKMKLTNPFDKFNYPELLKRHFWEGEFFYDDLSKQDYVAGDANLFPFVLGLITDKEMMEFSIKKIQEAGLDEPFPLKYTNGRHGISFTWEELLMPNYESTAIWTHMGPLYIKFVEQFNTVRAKEYKRKYDEMIEKHHSFLEVFNSRGKPFSAWTGYYSDKGMLWAANYLTL